MRSHCYVKKFNRYTGHWAGKSWQFTQTAGKTGAGRRRTTKTRLDLQFHDVAAGGRAHQAGADRLVGLVQGADVTRVLIVVDDLQTCWF